MKAFTCDFRLPNTISLHPLTPFKNSQPLGPNGWTRIGPDGIVSTSTNENKRNYTSSTDNYATKNKTRQSKKYYCSYGHGQNYSHSSQQCYKRKKLADNVYRPTYSYQNMLRQEVPGSAKQESIPIKTEHIKKEEDDDDGKSNENDFTRYSHAELKKLFGEVKKEMERRGIR
ncbi:hypothetical protein KCU71_g11315, partial [Aureobasidium melanogenum]